MESFYSDETKGVQKNLKRDEIPEGIERMKSQGFASGKLTRGGQKHTKMGKKTTQE